MDFFQSRDVNSPNPPLFAFQLWRVVHAPFVQDIRQYCCVSTYQNSDNDSIYLAVALRYSKDVDNSEQIRSQATLKILVYGSKA